jgi:hypothetical protein
MSVGFDGNLIIARSKDFADFYKELLLELQETLAFGSPSEVRRAAALIYQFQKLFQQVDAEARTWMEENLSVFYRNGDEFAKAQLQAMGLNEQSFLFYQVHESAIAHVVATMREEMLGATAQLRGNLLSFVRMMQVSPEEQRAVLREVARSVALGDATPTLSKNIETRLAARNVGGYIKVGSRTMKIESYAEMLARTHLRVAHSRGTEARLRANGINLIIISEHGTQCEICAPLENKIFSFDEGSISFPPVSMLPNEGTPFHPNCLHVELPLIPELAGEDVMAEGAFDPKTYPFDSSGKVKASEESD